MLMHTHTHTHMHTHTHTHTNTHAILIGNFEVGTAVYIDSTATTSI